MASLRKKSDGTFEIQYIDEYRRRKYITLSGGKFGELEAQNLKKVVETLLYNRANEIETLSRPTKRYLDDACLEIRQKLDRAGLYALPIQRTLGELWAVFLREKNDVCDSTLTTYHHAERRFFESFDRRAPLREMNTEMMLLWKNRLLGRYKEATVAGTLTKAKAVFNWAVAKGWLTESPLQGVGRGDYVNRGNDRNVTMAEYRRLLDACPCLEWRVLISLARIGGLRCPCEVVSKLHVRDFLLTGDAPRFLVHGKRTRKHPDGKERWVPLFPELREEVEKLLPRRRPSDLLITRYTDSSQNLGTQFARIVRKAGVQPIPRPFDNMRASRSTEIYHEFGLPCESEWLGHSLQVAQRHYFQVRNEDIARAAAKRTEEQ